MENKKKINLETSLNKKNQFIIIFLVLKQYLEKNIKIVNFISINFSILPQQTLKFLKHRYF